MLKIKIVQTDLRWHRLCAVNILKYYWKLHARHADAYPVSRCSVFYSVENSTLSFKQTCLLHLNYEWASMMNFATRQAIFYNLLETLVKPNFMRRTFLVHACTMLHTGENKQWLFLLLLKAFHQITRKKRI